MTCTSIPRSFKLHRSNCFLQSWFGTLLLILFFTVESIAQAPSFEHLNVEEGLSQTSVLCFAQDQLGFVWIGTRSGLNRFDSKQFKVYKKSPDNRKGSLQQDYIISLLSDSKNRLWVGSLHGLSSYDSEMDQFKNYNFDNYNNTGSGNYSVFCFLEDHRGRIWAGTGKGLKVLENAKDTLFKNLPLNTSGKEWMVKTMKEDFRGNLWVGTDNGLVRIKWNNGIPQFKRYVLAPKKDSLNQNYVITTLEEDEYRNLWIGTQGAGLFRYIEENDALQLEAGQKHPHVKLLNDAIRKIISDDKGQLWIGTQEGIAVMGIKSKSLSTYQHTPGNNQSLSQNSIYDLFFDKARNLWIGTYYGGINLIYSKKTPFHYYQNNGKKPDLNNNVVSAILEDEADILWVGTEGGGLNQINRKTGAVKYLKNDPNNPVSLGSNLVKCVFKSKSGQLWVGTHGGGLNLLQPNGRSFTQYKMAEYQPNGLKSNNVVQVVEDEKGLMWLATEDNGLHSFDTKTLNFEHYHNNANDRHKVKIWSSKTLAFDHLQTLWYGGATGLYYKIKGTDTFKEFKPDKAGNPTYPLGKEVSSLMQDSKNRLWIGTGSDGLFSWDIGNGKLKSYRTKDGLSSDFIKDLVEDNQGNLWVSTDNGLCKLDPLTEEIISYNLLDGLPGNQFNYNATIKDSQGHIFIGGLNGIVHFDPVTIEKNNQNSRLVFTGLKIGNHEQEVWEDKEVMDASMPLARKITLRHGQNIFTLNFSLLNFIKAQKNRYAYKLEGFEKEWNLSNYGTATYTNLAAGTYKLLVKGGNNDNYWNTQENSLIIEVLPPFWATWWAYSIYLLLLSGLFAAITRFFWLRARYRQEKELQQFKLDFFTNISHEIRTHLTLISSPLEAIMVEGRSHEFVKRQLNHIRKHTGILSELVGELLDFRKVESGYLKLACKQENLLTLLKECQSAFVEPALQKNIQLDLHCEVKELFAEIDRSQLQKVFTNLISNALKFSYQGGKVSIEASKTDRDALIRISDNGRGIAPKYFKKIFNNFFQIGEKDQENTGYGIGLAFSKSIVELHGGSIEVSSKPAREQEPGKTVFTILLPLKAIPKTIMQTSLKGNQSFPEIGTSTSANSSNKEKKLPTVLIIEDNDELRAFMKDALLEAFQIEEAAHGDAGLSAALELIPDLIVSDIMMPEMDGLELCDRLKIDPRSSHIPIILLTAKANLNDQIAGFEHRADAYLTKPFHIKLLETQINNLIENRKALQETYRKRFLSETTEPSGLPSISSEEAFLEKLNREVLSNLENQEFHVGDLAKAVAMSQPVLYKKLKALTGLSVNDFIKSIRLKKAVELLKTGQYTINEVSYMVGFADRKYFSREFKKAFGINPSEWEAHGKK